MTVVSYAQNFEDIMLLRALDDVSEGFYIDIGACAPDADSVTRLFYEKGWRGINVEPHSGYLQQLESKRPDDTNLGVVVSRERGTAVFHQVGDTGLSSTNPEIAKAHGAKGLPVTEREVPAVPLRDLWIAHVPEGQAVHFLKIDVEGAEADVLAGGDWTTHRPWLLVVEATAPNSQTPNHTEWESVLLDNDYSVVYWDGLNRFYLANEHQDRAGAFSAPPNVFDDFTLYSQVLIEQQAGALIEEARGLHETIEQQQQEIVKLRGELSKEKKRRVDLEREARHLTRPLWRRILFHMGGKPRRLLWRSLFHKNGKPRGVFRGLVLQKNGKPRNVFSQWMTSPEYQALPRAIRLIHQSEDHVPYEQMSARSRYFFDRLSAAERSGQDQ